MTKKYFRQVLFGLWDLKKKKASLEEVKSFAENSSCYFAITDALSETKNMYSCEKMKDFGMVLLKHVFLIHRIEEFLDLNTILEICLSGKK